MSRRTSILSPLLVVLLLFAAAIAGRTSRAANDAPSPVVELSHCSPSLQSGGSESTSVLYVPARFIQPIAGQAALGHVSVDVTEEYPYGTNGLLSVVAWDPVALAPDPTTVALRSRTYGTSEVGNNSLQLALDPPVVLQSVGGVAEPPRATVAIDYTMLSHWYPWEPQFVHWSPDGNPATPLAYDFKTGVAQPLPGSHGVLGHALCAANGAAEERICQSVMRCDTVPPPAAGNAVVQRFRVPEPTEVGWVELAFGPLGTTSAVGSVAILDAQGAALPPASPSGALVRADLGGVWVGAWNTHFDFDHTAILEPGHDYWLWVTTNGYYSLYLRRTTGGEDAAFRSGVSELWRRPTAGSPWSTDAHVLAFRIVGVPFVVTGVEPREVASASFRITAAPNPSAAATTLRWAGARGLVRFEVFDPTGRRVATQSTSGAEGNWTWRSARDARTAGVFFVRATDASGHTANLRVTIVR